MLRVRSTLFAVAIVWIAAAVDVAGAAPILIPTNLEKGADAEVRESQSNVDASGFVNGVNRGTSTELATRLATNCSSVGYAKFDISALLDSSDAAFWSTHPEVAFDLFVRNLTNFSQLTGSDAAGDATELRIAILALDPTGSYQAARNDRSGSSYTAANNQYDWSETGITFYDAPGIQPHCIQQGKCLGGDPNDIYATLGVYDDFDSNVLSLGTITPAAQYPSFADDALPVGTRLTFLEPVLRDLVLSARDAGEDTLTLMFHHLGPQADTVQTALGRNYLFAPKEQLMLDAGGGSLLDNSQGAYSPTLRIVPEPTPAVLAGLGLLLIGAARRRR